MSVEPVVGFKGVAEDVEQSPTRRLGAPIVAALALLVLPFGLSQLPEGGVLVEVTIVFLTYALVAQHWNLLAAHSGILSLAQMAIFGIGGYAAALTTNHVTQNPWTGLVVGPLAAMLAAIILGVALLRMQGIYVALLTLAFNELVRNFVSTNSMFGTSVGLSTPRFFTGSDIPFKLYYLGLAIFALGTFAVWRILRSPVGAAFQALRDSEGHAISRGIDRVTMRLFLFGYSAFFTGLAGAFYAGSQGVISAAVFDFSVLFLILMAIVIGGWGTFLGPIAGVAFLLFLDNGLKSQTVIPANLIYGLVLVIVVVWTPDGLVPKVAELVRRVRAYVNETDV